MKFVGLHWFSVKHSVSVGYDHWLSYSLKNSYYHGSAEIWSGSVPVPGEARSLSSSWSECLVLFAGHFPLNLVYYFYDSCYCLLSLCSALAAFGIQFLDLLGFCDRIGCCWIETCQKRWLEHLVAVKFALKVMFFVWVRVKRYLVCQCLLRS